MTPSFNPTRRDRIRLAKGAIALADPDATSVVLEEAIVALQSLDDLGTPEANQKAWDDMLELERRLRARRERSGENAS